VIGLKKPFRRSVRPFVDGTYSGDGAYDYIRDLRYAQHPDMYVRSFLLIQKDLLGIFDYLEPDDVNCKSYSFRIHELLVRTCIEVEANCKAIMLENGYSKATNNMNMPLYKRINLSHHLSAYKVRLPYWSGPSNIRAPFDAWGGKR
jgi:hypothetical protein